MKEHTPPLRASHVNQGTSILSGTVFPLPFRLISVGVVRGIARHPSEACAAPRRIERLMGPAPVPITTVWLPQRDEIRLE